MKRFFASFAVLLSHAVFVLAQSGEINIVPQPRSVSRNQGTFSLRKDTRIVVLYEGGNAPANLLNELLHKKYGFRLRIINRLEKRNVIVLYPVALNYQSNNLGRDETAEIKTEKYSLGITESRISIGGTWAGTFYAMQTLCQMLPAKFDREVKLRSLTIVDAPRFPYRGMHLDVARHFQPVEFVKKYIDLMARYKFNYFHWHLTDDQGWRIEIRKYPRLTEIGSKRPETHVGAYTTTFRGDGIPHGGFYTQKQIREVVRYAQERFITVIPEIELPGHASAALAAYPQFGCKENYNYKVQMTWGVFPEVFCPTEATIKFLEDVLDETIKLFPDSPYVHIGGDEVMKDHWKESAFVQELKKRENLKDEHPVQSYFVQRIEKFVNSRGKKIIGWDEILEGGIAPSATIMSWRGMKGGIEAARAKHDVIMTPTDYSYFDYRQGPDLTKEPVGQSWFLPLEKVYSFDPMPKDLEPSLAKYILGGQGNVWTEYMKTPAAVEYMVFPRMLAMSEAVWSTPANKDYADFRRRLAHHLVLLDKMGVKYRDPDTVPSQ